MVYTGLIVRTHKNIYVLQSKDGIVFENILTCLCCIKCSDINMSHLDVQKYVSYLKDSINTTNISCTGCTKVVDAFTLCVMAGSGLK